jgi:tetratricopeptide (TPR) repeat protein
MPAVLIVMMLLTAAVPATSDSKYEMAISSLRQGQEALRLEHWQDAEAQFTRAIGYDPTLEMAHYGLGQAYMAERRYDDAGRAYKGCRDAYLKNATRALTDDAELEHRVEDQVQALRDYRNDLTSRQNVPAGSPTLSIIDGQIAQLEVMRKRSTTGAPQAAPFISTALGSAYFRAGNLTLAEAEWHNALAVDPKIGEVHNNLAVLCMMTDRVPEAAEHVKAAEKAGLRVNPQLKQDIADKLH